MSTGQSTTSSMRRLLMSLRVTLGFVLVASIIACSYSRSGCTQAQAALWPVPRSWLVEELSVDEAEKRNTIDGVPFGHANADWKDLRASCEEGDRLWRYDSPHGWGTGGFLLLRNCTVVHHLVTVQYE